MRRRLTGSPSSRSTIRDDLMVSQSLFYRNDITGELFETKLQAIDSEFRSLHAASVQRGMFSKRTEDW